MTDPQAPLTLYKTWRLRDAADLGAVVALVSGAIAPHYARLSPDARLELEQLDERTLLAIQRWPSRAALEAATTGEGYEHWWQEYLPVLEQWGTLLDFVDEWEGSVLLA